MMWLSGVEGAGAGCLGSGQELDEAENEAFRGHWYDSGLVQDVDEGSRGGRKRRSHKRSYKRMRRSYKRMRGYKRRSYKSYTRSAA